MDNELVLVWITLTIIYSDASEENCFKKYWPIIVGAMSSPTPCMLHKSPHPQCKFFIFFTNTDHLRLRLASET